MEKIDGYFKIILKDYDRAIMVVNHIKRENPFENDHDHVYAKFRIEEGEFVILDNSEKKLMSLMKTIMHDWGVKSISIFMLEEDDRKSHNMQLNYRSLSAHYFFKSLELELEEMNRNLEGKPHHRTEKAFVILSKKATQNAVDPLDENIMTNKVQRRKKFTGLKD
jgi:hypothetical protein